MVVCATGSAPKPGAPAALSVTYDFMASILPPTLAWLRPFIPYIKPLYIDNVLNFCSVDPPGNPSISGLTFSAVFAGGEPGAAFVVSEAVSQILLNYIWYSLCQCNSGGTPAPPAGPSAPVDLPALNPPSVVGPSASGGCGTFESPQTLSQHPGGDWTSLLGSVDIHNSFVSGVAIPTGATSVVITFRRVPNGASHVSTAIVLALYNAAGTNVAFRNQGMVTDGPIDFTLAVPSTATQFTGSFNTSSVGPESTDYHVVKVVFYCGGGLPGAPVSPCCPPDPIAMGLLNQIYGLVKLIQRQNAPFAYIPGTVHSGLTGNGQFAVHGLIGLAIAVTTLPARAGLAVGDPNTTFNVGWVNVGTADGWFHRERITSNPWLLLPDDMAAMTLVGYSIPGDVVVTITELKREP